MRTSTILLLAVLAGIASAVPDSAEARRRFTGFSMGASGETIDEVATLPATAAWDFGGQHADLGYLYERTSVIGIPVFANNSKGRFVLYSGDRYTDMTPALRMQVAAELKTTPEQLYQFSFWRAAWGMFLFAPLLLLGVYAKVRDGFRQSV